MTSLIDADIMQTAMGIRGNAARIQETVFKDVEPFDPEKFISDVIA